MWDWGAYVNRLDNGWLATAPDAKAEDPATNHTAIDETTFRQWAEETHKAAPTVWYLRPADDVLDELGSRTEINYIHTMLREGSGADRQLKVFRETNNLKSVVDYMAAETRAGL